jgi:hypothetical protein
VGCARFRPTASVERAARAGVLLRRRSPDDHTPAATVLGVTISPAKRTSTSHVDARTPQRAMMAGFCGMSPVSQPGRMQRLNANHEKFAGYRMDRCMAYALAKRGPTSLHTPTAPLRTVGGKHRTACPAALLLTQDRPSLMSHPVQSAIAPDFCGCQTSARGSVRQPSRPTDIIHPVGSQTLMLACPRSWRFEGRSPRFYGACRVWLA